MLRTSASVQGEPTTVTLALRGQTDEKAFTLSVCNDRELSQGSSSGQVRLGGHVSSAGFLSRVDIPSLATGLCPESALEK